MNLLAELEGQDAQNLTTNITCDDASGHFADAILSLEKSAVLKS